MDIDDTQPPDLDGNEPSCSLHCTAFPLIQDSRNPDLGDEANCITIRSPILNDVCSPIKNKPSSSILSRQQPSRSAKKDHSFNYDFEDSKSCSPPKIERVLWMREKACKGDSPFSTVSDNYSHKVNSGITINGVPSDEYINNLQKSIILYKSMAIRKPGTRSVYQPFLLRNLYQQSLMKHTTVDKIISGESIKDGNFSKLNTHRKKFISGTLSKFEKMARLSYVVSAIKERELIQEKLKSQFNIRKKYSVDSLAAFDYSGNTCDLFPYETTHAKIMDENGDSKNVEVLKPINYYGSMAEIYQKHYQKKVGNGSIGMEIKFIGDSLNTTRKMKGTFYATFIAESVKYYIPFGRAVEISKNRFTDDLIVDLSEIIRMAMRKNARKLYITTEWVSVTASEKKKMKRKRNQFAGVNEADKCESYLKSFLIWEKNAPCHGIHHSHDLQNAWFTLLKSSDSNKSLSPCDCELLSERQEGEVKMLISIVHTFSKQCFNSHYQFRENIEWDCKILKLSDSITRNLRTKTVPVLKRGTKEQRKKENLLSNMVPEGSMKGEITQMWIEALRCDNIEYRLFHKVDEVQNLFFRSFEDDEVPKPSDDVMEKVACNGSIECIICNRQFHSTYHLLSHYHYSYPRLAFVANCEFDKETKSVKLNIDVFLDPSFRDIDEVGRRKRWESDARWIVFPPIAKYFRSNMRFDASIFSTFIPSQIDYFYDDLSNCDQYPETPTIHRQPENAFLRCNNLPACGWQILSTNSGRRIWDYLDLSYESKVFFFTWNTMIYKIGNDKIPEIGIYRLTKLYIYLHRSIIDNMNNDYKEIIKNHISNYVDFNSNSNNNIGSVTTVMDLQARIEDRNYNGLNESEYTPPAAIVLVSEYCRNLISKYEEWKRKTENWPKTPSLWRREALWPRIVKAGIVRKLLLNDPQYVDTYYELVRKGLLPPDHEARVIAEHPLEFFKTMYGLERVPQEILHLPKYPERDTNAYKTIEVTDGCNDHQNGFFIVREDDPKYAKYSPIT